MLQTCRTRAGFIPCAGCSDAIDRPPDMLVIVHALYRVFRQKVMLPAAVPKSCSQLLHQPLPEGRQPFGHPGSHGLLFRRTIRPHHG